jgi:acyl-coenzyme A thioesterase PaaI-like protein
MTQQALQEMLPPGAPYRMCFGCGVDNEHGLHVRSYVEGDRVVCRLTPAPHHLAMPGMVNGGILATAIDCHGIWTAVAHRLRDRPLHESAVYVTRKLTVEYLKPTPTGQELLLTGRVIAEGPSSITAAVEVTVNGTLVARGEVVGALFA